jgi:hypothetical protein
MITVAASPKGNRPLGLDHLMSQEESGHHSNCSPSIVRAAVHANSFYHRSPKPEREAGGEHPTWP